MRVGMIVPNRRWRRRGDPHRAVVAGLRRLGHDVEIAAPGRWPVLAGLPDLAFVWNGAKSSGGKIAGEFRSRQIATIVMERGFFDRFQYTQLDHAGFNHKASWAARLDGPAPDAGLERLDRVCGPRTAVAARGDGYVLILLQVSGDPQLADCEIHRPELLARTVVDATPSGVDIRIRPHPLGQWTGPVPRPAQLMGGSLRRAVRGARFVVTANSNSGNEALGWGCPVLTLGPSLYGLAGVALRTTLADMATMINLMLRGYQPSRHTVENYLRWLASRQWNNRELASGHVLRVLIDDAMKGPTNEL